MRSVGPWVKFLYFLIPTLQASSYILCMHSPVCVGLDRKPRRQVFLQSGSHKTPHTDILTSDSCTEPVPNMAYGNTSVYSRPNGASTTRQCKEGYHRHALARDDVPVCHSGTWVLHTTISDTSVTPATFCVPNGQYTEQSFCYLITETSPFKSDPRFPPNI